MRTPTGVSRVAFFGPTWDQGKKSPTTTGVRVILPGGEFISRSEMSTFVTGRTWHVSRQRWHCSASGRRGAPPQDDGQVPPHKRICPQFSQQDRAGRLQSEEVLFAYAELTDEPLLRQSRRITPIPCRVWDHGKTPGCADSLAFLRASIAADRVFSGIFCGFVTGSLGLCT